MDELVDDATASGLAVAGEVWLVFTATQLEAIVDDRSELRYLIGSLLAIGGRSQCFIYTSTFLFEPRPEVE